MAHFRARSPRRAEGEVVFEVEESVEGIIADRERARTASATTRSSSIRRSAARSGRAATARQGPREPSWEGVRAAAPVPGDDRVVAIAAAFSTLDPWIVRPGDSVPSCSSSRSGPRWRCSSSAAGSPSASCATTRTRGGITSSPGCSAATRGRCSRPRSCGWAGGFPSSAPCGHGASRCTCCSPSSSPSCRRRSRASRRVPLGLFPSVMGTVGGAFRFLVVMALHGGMLTYWAIHGAQRGLRYYRGYEERSRDALALELRTAESRPGSRRRSSTRSRCSCSRTSSSTR